MSTEAPTLSPVELQHYQRQMLLPGIGASGQALLKKARVIVVGAGGLGCPVISYLAAGGIGTLKIVDYDRVERSNLHRQPLYGVESIGRAKSDEARRAAECLNPGIKVQSIERRIEESNVRELLSDIDIVVDGSDNFAAKYLLNDACVELDKPLVSAAIFCFEGQLSVFNAPLTAGGRGPSYRCLYPEPPPAGLVPSCAEAGVLGVLPGIIGSLQALEVLKLILGIGDSLVGRLLIFDALRNSFSEVSFNRNAQMAQDTKIQCAEYYRELSPRCDAIPSLNAKELRLKLARHEDLVLIDVREPYEKAEFDIGGTLIPLGSLVAQAHLIPRDRPVVIYCKGGARSRQGISQLQRELGYNNLWNLDGGMMAWQREADDHAA